MVMKPKKKIEEFEEEQEETIEDTEETEETKEDDSNTISLQEVISNLDMRLSQIEATLFRIKSII